MDQLRVLGLKLLQRPVQLVVLLITERRIVQHVVAVVVGAYFFAQRTMLFLGR
jgi:hypothetical protein